MDIARKMNLDTPEDMVFEYQHFPAKIAQQQWIKVWMITMRANFDQQMREYPRTDDRIKLLVDLFLEASQVSFS